jgi:peroxiredoxin
LIAIRADGVTKSACAPNSRDLKEKQTMRMFLTIASAALVASMASAQLAPGAKAPPTFKAIDAGGKSRTLGSLSGQKGTVLVFIRSAKWCPYCQAQLKTMKALQAPLAKRGYSLAALSYDSPGELAKFARAQTIGYSLLSDSKSTVIDAFGVRDPAYGKGSFAHGVPKASTYVIDRSGTVRWRTIATDYKARDDNAKILAAVDGIR